MQADAEHAAVLRQWHDELAHHLMTATSMPERMAAIERAIEVLGLRGRPMVHTTIAESCARSGCAVVHQLAHEEWPQADD